MISLDVVFGVNNFVLERLDLVDIRFDIFLNVSSGGNQFKKLVAGVLFEKMDLNRSAFSPGSLKGTRK